MTIYRLGEIATINMCKRVFSKQTTEKGEVPFYKIGTIGGEADAFISEKLFNDLKSKYKYPEVGDSLITASGTIGKIVEFKGEKSYFQDSNIVWLKSRILNKKYLKYWLIKKPFKFTLGSTIKRLYNSDIRSTKIFVPKKNIQKQIIDIIEPHEKLFLKYNNCIRIDDPKNTKNDLNLLVKTLNPIDNLEHKVDQIKEIIDKTINFSIHNILGKEEFKLSEILSISSNKSENLISYGVGKNGLFKNDSKAKKLKRVDPFSICVGFVRTNNIDIGINGSKKDIGISAAYKVMDSNKSPILAYFIYKFIKNNYLKWSVSSSRGTGTINMKKLLNENVYLDIKKIEESKTYFKKLILLGETANKQKKKLVDIKKALINNLNYDVNQTPKIDF